MVKDTQRHISKLTCWLVEVRCSDDRDKSDNIFTAKFENPLWRHKQRKQLFYQNEYYVETKSFDQNKYDVKTKSFDTSCFFVDWNQLPKFHKDDVEGEDLDAKHNNPAQPARYYPLWALPPLQIYSW